MTRNCSVPFNNEEWLKVLCPVPLTSSILKCTEDVLRSPAVGTKQHHNVSVETSPNVNNKDDIQRLPVSSLYPLKQLKEKKKAETVSWCVREDG